MNLTTDLWHELIPGGNAKKMKTRARVGRGPCPLIKDCYGGWELAIARSARLGFVVINGCGSDDMLKDYLLQGAGNFATRSTAMLNEEKPRRSAGRPNNRLTVGTPPATALESLHAGSIWSAQPQGWIKRGTTARIPQTTY